MKTTWLHSMVQGDATQYYRKRNGIMVEHMVRPANFDMQYNHFHQEYEIYLLLRGRRQMFFENRAYEAQAGNLILVDSGQIHMSHSIVGDPETEYERVILYVDRDIVEKVDKMFPELKIGAFFHKHYGIYELTPKQTANTRRLFLQIMEELDKAEPMSQTAILSELILGFIHFRRSNQQVACLNDVQEGKASGGKFDTVYQISDYISDHFQETLSLDSLAEQFYISKYYLSRSFHEVTGFGIKEWDWPQGIGLYGLLKIAKIQDSEEYRTFLHDWFKENIAQGLPSRNINTTTPLLTLCELNEIYHDPEFEALCLDWAKWLMECIPRTREGGFQHVTSANGDCQGVRLNESEMWIDTLFMTVLFLNRMGQKYGKQEWIDESIKQVLMHIKYLYDTHTGLFFHGWSFNRMDNFGGVFWCRGNSWFTLGILDYLDMFKGTLNQGVKTFILDTYKAQVRALRNLQGEDGLWHTVLDDSTSYEETSGSAAITAGILKGIRMGILDDSYLPCAKKAIRAILKNIDTDGTVLKVSGGTGMGYDRDHYKNILIAPMAYGQSLTILALVEALETFE